MIFERTHEKAKSSQEDGGEEASEEKVRNKKQTSG